MIPVVVRWNAAEPGAREEEGSGKTELEEEAEVFELEEVGMTIDDATAEKTWSQTVIHQGSRMISTLSSGLGGRERRKERTGEGVVPVLP